MKTYYKVVTKNLTSCYVYGKALVLYRVDKFVKAPDWLPDGHQYLFVFRTQKEAMLFAYAMTRKTRQFQVFSRLGKRERKRLPDFLGAAGLAGGELPLPVFFATFPPGTVAVREVKLLERIIPFELPPSVQTAS